MVPCRVMIGAGTRLRDVEVVAELARGGMATLFLGRASAPERRVAIKVVHPSIANDVEVVKMFLDEARLSAAIRHPNVVRVEELGMHEGHHYLVMEYIDGVTLADLLRGLIRGGEALRVDVAVSIAAEVAAGLHAAHDCVDELGQPLNLVHRDVSPQNVLIDRRGHVKLIDFGVAKARHRLAQTVGGAVKGKLAYMAPEQLAGRAVDRRVDVFALGVVLWESLVLRRLFHRKDDLATMLAVQSEPILPPGAHRGDLPARLDDVVTTMLSRDPEERFATAAACRRAMLLSCPEALSVEPPAIAELVQRAASDALAERTDPARAGDEPTIPERRHAKRG